MTFAGVMSSYVLLIPLAATLLAGGDKCTPFRVALHYGLCSAPIAYWFQTLNTTLQIFQPVMGRSGMAVCSLPVDVEKYDQKSTGNLIMAVCSLPFVFLLSNFKI